MRLARTLRTEKRLCRSTVRKGFAFPIQILNKIT